MERISIPYALVWVVLVDMATCGGSIALLTSLQPNIIIFWLCCAGIVNAVVSLILALTTYKCNCFHDRYWTVTGCIGHAASVAVYSIALVVSMHSSARLAVFIALVTINSAHVIYLLLVLLLQNVSPAAAAAAAAASIVNLRRPLCPTNTNNMAAAPPLLDTGALVVIVSSVPTPTTPLFEPR
jgi:hypothetical protein